jgi:hypothetical protein
MLKMNIMMMIFMDDDDDDCGLCRCVIVGCCVLCVVGCGLFT